MLTACRAIPYIARLCTQGSRTWKLNSRIIISHILKYSSSTFSSFTMEKRFEFEMFHTYLNITKLAFSVPSEWSGSGDFPQNINTSQVLKC